MKERDSRRDAAPPRGVLSRAPEGAIEHRRVQLRGPLAERIAHGWWVRWTLERPFVAQTLSHPTVHLVFEPPGPARVVGVPRRRFERRLVGEGFVFGLKFRPAAFSEIVDDVSELTNQRVEARTVLRDLARLERDIAKSGSIEDCLEAVEARLRLPPLTFEAKAVRDLVERLERDRSFIRVEQVADALGVDVRTLQRLFRRHVGVSPKWVLSRYRLHEAAASLDRTPRPSLATLAMELGYADQAHFTRDFTRVIGEPPRAWARRP